MEHNACSHLEETKRMNDEHILKTRAKSTISKAIILQFLNQVKSSDLCFYDKLKKKVNKIKMLISIARKTSITINVFLLKML